MGDTIVASLLFLSKIKELYIIIIMIIIIIIITIIIIRFVGA